MRLQKILAPTDLSPLSVPAVRYALQTALEQRATVIVYHVVTQDSDWFGKDDPRNPAAALLPREQRRLREYMQENFRELEGKVNIAEVVEAGVPYSSIVAKADEEAAELIVMSTHGRTGVGEMIMGSVTAKVVARARCPVLTMKPMAS
ncbi:MAG TPA: universal stress protein [Candidatus Binatia bacterium]|nr:universal stress protein [Candidatus Binatia bacterium]